MNEQRDDTELERYLDGESGESRAYAELGDEIPPPELDARILVEAERAVKVTEFDSRRAPAVQSVRVGGDRRAVVFAGAEYRVRQRRSGPGRWAGLHGEAIRCAVCHDGVQGL